LWNMKANMIWNSRPFHSHSPHKGSPNDNVVEDQPY